MLLTEALINRLAFLIQRETTLDDKQQVRRCLVDYLGVTFAGSKTLKDKATLYADFIDSDGAYSVIGYSKKNNLATASFLNGLFAHVAELDDGDRYGMFHPGAPLFSALLPLMQRFEVSTKDFEKAVICGYEASMLIARTLQPFIKEKGFHGTGIAGTIGAAISCSVALNANKEELKSSLSAACTSAAGLLKVIKGKSQMKPLNVAYAAQNGLQAALLAKSGFSGSYDVLDGKLGFFHAFSDQLNMDVLLDASKTDDALIHSIYVKPFAACRHCHAPIEAAINIANNTGFASDAIDSVEVETYSWAITGHDHTEIKGMNSAKMSIPYSVAAALLHKSGDIEIYDNPYLTNDTVLALTKKVNVIENSEMTRKAPGERGARVKIKVKAEEMSFFVALPKGEPENPVTDSELVQKTSSLCAFAGLQDSQIQQVVSLMDSKQLDSEVLKNVLYSL
ncbi:MmgE/PrpD family protein [Cyclonatronum proteinivorum]|uniref:MmgE/PrpD family protein n=1 Tax=Cyclonatronum proteinivorum TaxID=1457365 RepID=UPI000E0EF16F|nr:MmgE/PrpD family protein [Cyclonatronum proteinivorum]